MSDRIQRRGESQQVTVITSYGYVETACPTRMDNGGKYAEHCVLADYFPHDGTPHLFKVAETSDLLRESE